MDEPTKHDADKPRLELIPPEALFATGRVLAFGARKYAPGNWATGCGFEWSRLVGGALRHISAFQAGEDRDPESGESHIAHALCMLAFLMAHIEREHGKDDRIDVGTKAITDRVRQSAALQAYFDDKALHDKDISFAELPKPMVGACRNDE